MKKSIDELCLLKNEADDGLLGLYDVSFQNSEDIAKELKEEIRIRKDELLRLKKAHLVYSGFAKHGVSSPQDRGQAMLEAAKAYQSGKLLYEASASGYPQARLEYAFALAEGEYGLTANPSEALSILVEEADKGNADASYGIVTFQKQHPDMVDPEMAYSYCQKAARLGHEKAEKRLLEPFEQSKQTSALLQRYQAGEKGVAYLLSFRQDIPLKKREEYLWKALEEGDGRAEYDVGKGLYEAKEYDMARPYYEKAIAHGNGQACFGLAKIVLHGLPHFYKSGGLPKKIHPEHYEELKLIEKAAELGDIRGLCVMARAYIRGYLVEKDEEKAMAYLEKAYEEGERFDAPRLIAEIYRNHAEARKAVEYYKIAAEHGNVSAMLGLMDIYEKGLGDIEPNPSKATYYRFLAGVDDF